MRRCEERGKERWKWGEISEERWKEEEERERVCYVCVCVREIS